MPSPNLDITEVSEVADQKIPRINQSRDLLERALTNLIAINMDDTNQTLTTTEGGEAKANLVYTLENGTSAPSTDLDVIVPTNTKLYIVRDDTTGGFTMTIKVSGQPGVPVPKTGFGIFYCDGTDVVQIGPTLSTPNVWEGSQAAKRVTLASVTNATAVNFDLGNFFQLDLGDDNENTTIQNVTNPPASDEAATISFVIIQDATTRTVSWDTTYLWPGGTAPTQSANNNEVDVYTGVWNGTAWLMNYAQNFA